MHPQKTTLVTCAFCSFTDAFVPSGRNQYECQRCHEFTHTLGDTDKEAAYKGGVLQSVLQCVAVFCSVSVSAVTNLPTPLVIPIRKLPTNEVCCSVLQCVAVCCSMSVSAVTNLPTPLVILIRKLPTNEVCCRVCCSVLQYECRCCHELASTLGNKEAAY